MELLELELSAAVGLGNLTKNTKKKVKQLALQLYWRKRTRGNLEDFKCTYLL